MKQMHKQSTAKDPFMKSSIVQLAELPKMYEEANALDEDDTSDLFTEV